MVDGAGMVVVTNNACSAKVLIFYLFELSSRQNCRYACLVFSDLSFQPVTRKKEREWKKEREEMLDYTIISTSFQIAIFQDCFTCFSSIWSVISSNFMRGFSEEASSKIDNTCMTFSDFSQLQRFWRENDYECIFHDFSIFSDKDCRTVAEICCTSAIIFAKKRLPF